MTPEDSQKFDYDDIDLSRSSWLSRFIARFAATYSHDAERTDWSTQVVWAVADARQGKNPSIARATFVRTLHWQLAVIADLRRRYRKAEDTTPLTIDLAAVLALGEDCPDAYLEIRQLLDVVDLGADPNSPTFQRNLRSAVKQVELVLLEGLLSDDHPLLNRSFHHVFTACDTVVLTRLAALHFQRANAWQRKAEAVHGLARVQKMAFVEGIIAMSMADGVLAPMESRLISELLALGRFTAEERHMIEATKEEPVTPSELAQMVVGEHPRGELIKQLLFAALLDDELSEPEESFLMAVVDEMGLSKDKIACLELEVSEVLLSEPRIRDGLTFVGLVSRLQKHAAERVESAVRRNAAALMAEVRETATLMKLLAEATGRTLTEAEKHQVHSQLLDIAKTLPSLALFAAPGGTVLVPLMLKVLPFDLMPSAFSEEDAIL